MLKKLSKLLVAILCFTCLFTVGVSLYYEEFVMENSIVYDFEKTYQTIEEGFGASACWWAPDVGTWNEKTQNGNDIKEEIAKLLYDDTYGLGMDVYRYNVGAAVDGCEGNYSHYWRTVESFLTADGTYDFTRDEGGRKMLELALKYGASEVVLFANSPPNSMTINGKAHSSNGKCNIAPERYLDYAKYFCDIAEYFVSVGVPVSALSPVNEPEWEWKGGQEGCHYEPSELVAFYEVFIKELETRPSIKDIPVSIYESGKVGDRIYEYVDALMASDIIRPYFKKIEAHSYWSTSQDKTAFYKYIQEKYPELKVSMTEWCQMQNGRAVSLLPSFTIANVVMDDLTILNATSWQYWLGVSAYNYEDGLLYVNLKDRSSLEIPLRYYAFSMFTKYIKKGAVRIDATLDLENEQEYNIRSCTFLNPNGDLVTVYINEGQEIELYNKGIRGKYNIKKVCSLLSSARTEITTKYSKSVVIPAESITTVIYSK